MDVKKNLKDAWEQCRQTWKNLCWQYHNKIQIAQMIGIGLLLFSTGFFGPWLCSLWLNDWQSGALIAVPIAIIFAFTLYFAGAAQYQFELPSQHSADEYGFGTAAAGVANLFVGAVIASIMLLCGMCIFLGMLLYSLTMQGWLYCTILSASFFVAVPIEGFLFFYLYAYSVIFIRSMKKKSPTA